MKWNPFQWYSSKLKQDHSARGSNTEELFSTLIQARSHLKLSIALRGRQPAIAYRDRWNVNSTTNVVSESDLAKYGYALVSLGHIKSGKDVFQSVLERRPTSLVASYFLGLVNVSEGNPPGDRWSKTTSDEQAEIAALDLMSIKLRRIAYKINENGKDVMNIVTFEGESLTNIKD